MATEPVTETLSEPAKYRKAIMGAALAAVTTAATASIDGFTVPEYWGIAAAAVAVFVGVFGVTNKPLG
jgi:hypothetical protein